jgi:integrase
VASIKQTSTGWRAQVYVRGIRDSQCFRTRREATAWGATRESELRDAAAKPPGEARSLRDALERYRNEVTPTKRGRRWEALRIDAMLATGTLPLDTPIGRIQPDDFNAWRAARQREVKPGTILREFGILSAVFETARREWRWVPANPVADVRKPPAPAHRERIISRAEARQILRALGHTPRRPPRSITQAVAIAFLLALRTGMRQGELCGLEWHQVHAHHCNLPVTKTVARDVPLTPKSRRLIERMRGFDAVKVFGVSAPTLDALFRRARKNSGLEGFTFHDTRHTAATWLAQRINVLDLCKMFGWKDPKRAMTYYNPTAADIARRIG